MNQLNLTKTPTHTSLNFCCEYDHVAIYKTARQISFNLLRDLIPLHGRRVVQKFGIHETLCARAYPWVQIRANRTVPSIIFMCPASKYGPKGWARQYAPSMDVERENRGVNCRPGFVECFPVPPQSWNALGQRRTSRRDCDT